MASIQAQMNGVWSAVAAATGGGGAAVMFVGARSDVGISEVARAFAEVAAARAARAAWLVDLDFFGPGQFAAYGGEQAAMKGPFDMTFATQPFWRAQPKAADGSQGEGALVSFRTPVPKLFVSRFNRAALQAGQKMQVSPAPSYWQAVRKAIDMTVVDAPAREYSRAGLALVPDMDGVILVIDSQISDVRESIDLRDEIIGRGGRCLGIVVTETASSGFKLRRQA